MKKIFGILIALFLAFNAGAQDQPQVLSSEENVQSNKRGNQKDILKEVNLSKTQKRQVKVIMHDIKTRKQEINSNTTLSGEEKKAAIQKLAGEQRSRIYELLTFEQKKQIASRQSAYAKKRKPIPRRGVTNLPNERTSK
ncbi:MAG: hypothetical protein ABIQ56_05935 [Chitinophagaceae bacterium]